MAGYTVKLNININQQDNRFLITIEDNGIGREQAVKLKTSGTKKGLSITNQIFSLYKKIFKYDITQEIIDLKNNKGEAAGTKVILSIDLN